MYVSGNFMAKGVCTSVTIECRENKFKMDTYVLMLDREMGDLKH